MIEMKISQGAKRVSRREVMTFGEIYEIYKPGDLANGEAPERFQMMWDLANPDTSELAEVVTTIR
jgi:hypothetical protein